MIVVEENNKTRIDSYLSKKLDAKKKRKEFNFPFYYGPVGFSGSVLPVSPPLVLAVIL